MRKDPVCERKNHLPSRQCTCPQKCFGNGEKRELYYECLEHPPYSPELSPSDFCLFPKPKLFLACQHFSSNQEAIAAVDGLFCRSCGETLLGRVNGAGASLKNLKGDYVQIKNNFEIINSFFHC
jgi:hypothetical protein